MQPHCLRDGFWRNFKVIVKILIGRARAKTGHADKNPIFADDRVPALTDRRFDPDPHGGIANDLLAPIAVLSQRKVPMQGTDTTRAKICRAAKMRRASSASETSEPDANIETLAGPPSAGASS